MKAVGNQLISLLPVHHLLSLIHTCCFPFLPHCSPTPSWPFWSLGESCVFQRDGKRQPYCSSEGRPRDKHMLPPVLSALSTPLVSLYSRLVISPPAACTLFPPAYTPTRMSDSANAHTRACAHIHTYRNVHATTVGPLLSDNHHTKTNQGVPLLKAHPFLTLHIIGVFLAWTQTSGGCLVERKACVLGRELICRIGVTQRVERGSQKSFKMKN